MISSDWMISMDEHSSLISPSGFREYDARWRYGTEIDLKGVYSVGLGLGTMLQERGGSPRIVTGYDYRSYSEAIQRALNSGLEGAGCEVHDIGLALTPMAYFAQYALDVPAVAMVTASHNENGWTGIKMGFERPFTFAPEEMTALKTLVLGKGGRASKGGLIKRIPGIKERYIADLLQGRKLDRRLKLVIACGNGTAGAFAPEVFSRIGCDIVPLHCDLDYSFPNHNPNPEDLAMLKSLSEAVVASGADAGLAFDGDGDRCGTVDNEGKVIFADKIGVLLARRFSEVRRGAKFVVDVKSTGLFETDPVLKKQEAKTEYWKTGHSYMKRQTAEIGAVAGFEKSGHYFFQPPYGRGYDDGLLSGIVICEMLASSGKSMADLYRDLPRSWTSPTMSPHCADDEKYAVVQTVSGHIRSLQQNELTFAGKRISQLNMVNGIRLTLEDGSWGLLRASSNKPELVIVCESPASEEGMREVFGAIDELLRGFPEVGAFNQRI
jgi:phosphomannomutase / phosphoglucomutase